MRTAGAPAALALSQEPLLTRDLAELRWVRVGAVDAKGVAHPLATNRVSFRLSGPGELVAVGNGDPTGMRPFTETDAHDLFFGKAMAVVRRTGPGTLTLTATAEGLAEGVLEIK